MPTAPTDSVEYAIELARERLNDMIESTSGEIVTDIAPFTPFVINGAWRRILNVLRNFGYQALTNSVQFSGPTEVVAAGSMDPGTFVYINWAGYFDGIAAQASPALPQDMISPFDLYSRIAGSNGRFRKMAQAMNGLPTIVKGPLNRHWEWTGEAVRMCGATFANDIRVRYGKTFPDFIVPSSTVPPTPYASQQVPLVDVLSPLAWWMAREVSTGRNDVDLEALEKSGQEELTQVFNRDPRQGKSIFKRSEYGKMVGPDSPIEGPAGPRGRQVAA